eukprot:32495_1
MDNCLSNPFQCMASIKIAKQWIEGGRLGSLCIYQVNRSQNNIFVKWSNKTKVFKQLKQIKIEQHEDRSVILTGINQHEIITIGFEDVATFNEFVHHFSVQITKTNNNKITETFKWLDYCNKYFPMIVKTNRPTILYVIFLFITFHLCVGTYLYFVNLVYQSRKDSDIMYWIIFTAAFSLKLISRLLALKYYYKQFNYPWQHINITDIDSYNVAATYTNYRLLFWAVTFIFIYILQLSLQTFEYLSGKDDAFIYFLAYVDCIFIEAPTVIAQFTLSVILCIGVAQIDELIKDVEMHGESISFVAIAEKYKIYHDAFENSSRDLCIIMICKQFSILLWFWITVTNLKYTFTVNTWGGVFWTTHNGIIFIEFMWSATKLTKKYYHFRDRLGEMWFEGSFEDIESQDVHNNCGNSDYNLLNNYVQNCSFTLKFIEGEISINNIIWYISEFVFVMLVTYKIF